MPLRKLIFLKALLPLGLLAMAVAVFRRKPDEWEYERAEEEVEVAPAAPRATAEVRHPRRRFAMRPHSRLSSSPGRPSPPARAIKWPGLPTRTRRRSRQLS